MQLLLDRGWRILARPDQPGQPITPVGFDDKLPPEGDGVPPSPQFINMDENGMGVRFEFQALAGDRNLRNKVFDAVDIHGDWLRLQTGIYEITRQIDARLRAP